MVSIDSGETHLAVIPFHVMGHTSAPNNDNFAHNHSFHYHHRRRHRRHHHPFHK